MFPRLYNESACWAGHTLVGDFTYVFFKVHVSGFWVIFTDIMKGRVLGWQYQNDKIIDTWQYQNDKIIDTWQYQNDKIIDTWQYKTIISLTL
mgnify:FL=1